MRCSSITQYHLFLWHARGRNSSGFGCCQRCCQTGGFHAQSSAQGLAKQALPLSDLGCAGFKTVWSCGAQGVEPACMLGNLRAGCKYSVRVRCKNVAGWGAGSAPSEFLTMPDVPDAPLDLQTMCRCVMPFLLTRGHLRNPFLSPRWHLVNVICECKNGRCPRVLLFWQPKRIFDAYF